MMVKVVVPVGNFREEERRVKTGWGLLSPREREVAVLVGEGYTNKEVAARMGIAVSTVKTYVRLGAAKLGVRGKVGLRWVVRRDVTTK